MGWKEDNKGSGPWPFAAQPNKWGYLNNPRWLDPPTVPVNYDGREDEEPQVWDINSDSLISSKTSDPMGTHIPCGHWHRPMLVTPPTTPPPGVCIVYVDELSIGHWPYSSISGEGLYTSSDSLVYHNSYLYAAAGNTGIISRVNPVTMTVEHSTLFNPADISAFKQIIISGGIIYALILRSGYIGTWIQKISIPAVGSGIDFGLIDDPLYCGSVCIGTDGNVYGALRCLNMNAFWIVLHTPITGGLWSSRWERLPNAYSYNIDPNVSVYAGDVTLGSAVISFRLLDGVGYVIDHGPESGTTSSSSFISNIDFNGVRLNRFSGNMVIGPNELGQKTPSSDELVAFKSLSISGNLVMRYIDVSAITSIDYNISGLVVDGILRDNSVYHRRTIWHPSNNRIYTLYNLYSDTVWRIICVNPSGTLLYQYNGGDGNASSSFVILGNYIYVWASDVKGTTSVSHITKLTLNLDFVCREPCLGTYYLGYYREKGRCIVSDGSRYLYNYNRPLTNVGVITKWSTL